MVNACERFEAAPESDRVSTRSENSDLNALQLMQGGRRAFENQSADNNASQYLPGLSLDDQPDLEKQMLTLIKQMDLELQTLSAEITQLKSGSSTSTGQSDTSVAANAPTDATAPATPPVTAAAPSTDTQTASTSSDQSTQNLSTVDTPTLPAAGTLEVTTGGTGQPFDTGTGSDALHIGGMGGFGMSSVDASGQGFSQEYGVFEASMKLPAASGNTPSGWPGFWLISTAHATQNATSSEIDMMETNSSWSSNPNQYFTTLHKNSGTDSDQQNADNAPTTFADGTPLPTDLTTAYHTYGVVWPKDGNSLTYTLDGKAVETVPKYDSTDSSPMMVILGQDTVGASPLDVKSVNVYQYADQVNSANDPGGTQTADSSQMLLTDPTTNNTQTLVNTFHQDFTSPQTDVNNVLSNDGAADSTVWTNHLWYEQPGNTSAVSESAA